MMGIHWLQVKRANHWDMAPVSRKYIHHALMSFMCRRYFFYKSDNINTLYKPYMSL